jgi:hypothetical protein
LESLFQSGRVVDLILGLILLELAGLAIWRALGKTAPGTLDVLPYLMSGAALLVALRISLTGGAWPLMALALLAAFAAHLFDLYRRWPRPD